MLDDRTSGGVNRILLSEVRPGMVLADDVCGSNNRRLLARGTVVEDRHLRVLNIWGVHEVAVEGAGVAQLRAEHLHGLDEGVLARARERVELRFAPTCAGTAFLDELRRLCVLEYARRFSSGWVVPEPCPHSVAGIPVRTGYDLREFIDSDRSLASFPDIYFRLTEAIDNPSSTAAKLADIISKDPNISAKLLSLVNSPLYGFAGRVDSLARSITLIGSRDLSQLVLGISVMNSFSRLGNSVLPVRELWKHALACAVFARILSVSLSGLSAERSFVIGMLHDVGRLVMLQIAPQACVAAMTLARQMQIPMHDAERQIFGFDHGMVAQELFLRWKLPAQIVDAIAAHHELVHLPEPCDAAVCSVANLLATALEYGLDGGGALVHPPARGAWEALGLPASILQATMLKAHRQISDIYTVFLR